MMKKTKRNRILATIPAVSIAAGLALASPAQARDRGDAHWSNSGYDQVGKHARSSVRTNWSAALSQLDRDIRRAESRRTISHREAASLRRDLKNLQSRYRSYSRDGMSRHDAQKLTAGIRDLRADLNRDKRDFDRRRG